MMFSSLILGPITNLENDYRYIMVLLLGGCLIQTLAPESMRSLDKKAARQSLLPYVKYSESIPAWMLPPCLVHISCAYLKMRSQLLQEAIRPSSDSPFFTRCLIMLKQCNREPNAYNTENWKWSKSHTWATIRTWEQPAASNDANSEA